MRQAGALETALREDFDARVEVAMRYWRPFTEDAIRQMEQHRPEEMVLLPLYPQGETVELPSAAVQALRLAPGDSVRIVGL